MRITAIETIHLARGVTVHAGPIQWLWVRIHTNEGLIGLGETYPHPEAEKGVVHRSLAPVLLGRDARHQRCRYGAMGPGRQSRRYAVYQLLGGASGSSIRAYTTCYDHVSFLTEPV